MAPTTKRSSVTEGMEPEADTAPQSSITVAGAVAAPTATDNDDTSSTRSSPEAVVKSADEVAMPAPPGPPIKERNNGAMPMMPVATRTHPSYDYEFSDIDEITMRQLNEDILAYDYDLNYCQAQLAEADLTPQETRTLQLRTLDLGHQIRHCKHRIETIGAQTRKQVFRAAHGGMPLLMMNPSNGTNGRARNVSAGYGGALLPAKRVNAAPPVMTPGKRSMHDEDGVDGSAKRVKTHSSPDPEMMEDGVVNTALQRLGFWKCRLCSAPKYLLAGSGRTPAAPCKWPLKDISKMITHFTEMHSEHSPSERCTELGAALTQNRGPFEYWLRRTRAQNISDGGIIDDCLSSLLDGDMPVLLRRHSRAAAGMPSS